MKRLYCSTLVAVALAATASCTHYPRATGSAERLTDLRTRYVANHPQGEFNDHIARGEVTRGMSGMEVLASWGKPDARETTRKNNEETWTYFQSDEQTRDYVVYDLFFADRMLTGWDMTRVTAALGFVTYREFQRAREESLRKATGLTSSGSVKRR